MPRSARPPSAPGPTAGPTLTARSPSLIALATLLSACGAQSDDARAGRTVVDSADVRIVESRMPALAEGALFIEPEPELRIGDDEGPAQFGALFLGLLLPEGEIAVVDAMANELRLFGPGGSHLRTFGGSGQGPGEFLATSALLEYRGDSLAVFDQVQSRATIFSRSTGSHRSFPLELEGNFTAFGALDDGSFLFYSPGSGYRPDLPPGLQWVATDIVATDPSGGSIRKIAEMPQRQQLVQEGGDTGPVIPLMNSIRAASGDGFYWATSDRWQIRYHDAEGRLRRIVRRPVEPEEVEPHMVEAYIDVQLERVRSFEGDAAVPRYRRMYEEEAHFGNRVPLFERAFVDGDERLWVAESPWPLASGDPTRRWSVFSPQGAWLGDLEAPAGLRILDGRGDRILGVWFDELDVPHVQVHRVRGL